MTVSLVPVGPGVPDDLKAILQSHADAIQALQQPGAPSQAFTIATSADLLAQAPAANWPGGFAVVTDVPCLAISVETSPGTWAWKRADGSAL